MATYTKEHTFNHGTSPDGGAIDLELENLGKSVNSITSGQIVDGTIVNADVNASAAIVYSKLSLANSLAITDLVSGSVWADYTPTFAFGGTLTSSSNVVNKARWMRIFNIVYFYIDVSVTLNGGTGNRIRLSLPVTAANTNFGGGCTFYDGSEKSANWWPASTTTIDIFRYDSANLTVTGTQLKVQGHLEV